MFLDASVNDSSSSDCQEEWGIIKNDLGLGARVMASDDSNLTQLRSFPLSFSICRNVGMV